MLIMCAICIHPADGHHKLIRWRVVTHGAIDGFSRLIVFLQCSTNNRASTVYDLFLGAVGQYGLPSRVRTDQGRENVQVAQHILQSRGVNRRSIIVGSSVHNQRIERLWKDSHRCATSFFYRLFYYMEQHDLLDVINENHLFALHYVYLPCINRSRKQFKEAWNCHGLRTERGKTPNQLFTAGLLRLRYSGLDAVDLFEDVSDEYGESEEGGSHNEEAVDDDQGASVPQLSVSITPMQLSRIREAVNPFSEDSEYGISLYRIVLQILDNP